MKVDIKKYNKGPVERKIKVQIDSFDTYSLDHTLAVIILPALIQLKETMHGVPNDFVHVGGDTNVEDQMCFGFYSETYNESFEVGCKKWEEVLNKMIWAFDQIVKDEYSDLYHHGNIELDWIKSDTKSLNPLTGKMEETYNVIDKNPKEHWYDHNGMMKHEERIQEGLELFGKYYRALWD